MEASTASEVVWLRESRDPCVPAWFGSELAANLLSRPWRSGRAVSTQREFVVTLLNVAPTRCARQLTRDRS